MVEHHQWRSDTTTQHYQLTSPSLFTGAVTAASAAGDGFTTIQLVEPVVEQNAENHLNNDGGENEQHGVWQQL